MGTRRSPLAAALLDLLLSAGLLILCIFVGTLVLGHYTMVAYVAHAYNSVPLHDSVAYFFHSKVGVRPTLWLITLSWSVIPMGIGVLAFLRRVRERVPGIRLMALCMRRLALLYLFKGDLALLQLALTPPSHRPRTAQDVASHRTLPHTNPPLLYLPHTSLTRS